MSNRMKTHSFILPCAVAAMLASCAPTDTQLATADAGSFDQSLLDSVFVYAGNAGQTDEMQAITVIKNGKVVARKFAPEYGPDHLFILWSGTKTFNACAVGFAQQEGLLDVDDPVLKYLNDYPVNENTSDWWSEMTIRHLLCMGSGITYDPSALLKTHTMKDGVKNILASELATQPGSRYKYNSMNSYLLSAIVTKVTGEKVADYLKPRLLEPLGIRNYIWTESAEGLNYGGWGLYLTNESFAKIGLLYLQKGVWNGQRLLEQSWFDESMSPQIMQFKPEETEPEQLEKYKTSESNQGYGFQMWCCTHGAYRLDGAWGQYSIIIPEKNAVIAINEVTRHTAKTFEAVWKYIYPAL